MVVLSEQRVRMGYTDPTLRVLVERAGVPVSKDALIEAGWAGLAVKEGNLTVQIAAVRRALGQEPGGRL